MRTQDSQRDDSSKTIDMRALGEATTVVLLIIVAVAATGTISFAIQGFTDGLQPSAGGNVNFDQEGGNLTVTVTEVLPNGVLRIRGEKWLSLTNGDEYIRLTGLVRPQDITPDNTVPSQRIANARIAYGGTGDFDQANQPGWLTRFFNSEWWPL